MCWHHLKPFMSGTIFGSNKSFFLDQLVGRQLVVCLAGCANFTEFPGLMPWLLKKEFTS